MFANLDLTKDDANTDIDFAMLDEMFCRPQAEIDAEEAKQKAARDRKNSFLKK